MVLENWAAACNFTVDVWISSAKTEAAVVRLARLPVIPMFNPRSGLDAAMPEGGCAADMVGAGAISASRWPPGLWRSHRRPLVSLTSVGTRGVMLLVGLFALFVALASTPAGTTLLQLVGARVDDAWSWIVGVFT